MKYTLKSILLLVIAIPLGCGPISSDSQEQQLPPVNAKQIKLVDLDNQYIDLDVYKGKTIFINFWATWCKPCIAEMPSILKAQNLLKDEPVVFLLASNEPKEKIARFIASNGFDFEYLQLMTPFENLDIRALPTTFIISPDGEIVYTQMGGKEWDKEENLDLIRSNFQAKAGLL